MIAEVVNDFVEILEEKTKNKEIIWTPLTEFPKPNYFNDFILQFEGNNVAAKIRYEESYFINNNGGYIFLIEIQMMDSISEYNSKMYNLLIKPNIYLSLFNLTDFTGCVNQTALVNIKNEINKYIDDTYIQPDVIINFLSSKLN